MFTGIVSGRGEIVEVEQLPDDSVRLRLRADPGLLADLERGGSLAVNGVCLTAERDAGGGFSAVAMGETLARTTLGALVAGDQVNLERCAKIGERIDGHIVQGHVDAVGEISVVQNHGDWSRVRINVPARLAPQLVEKGSVVVDGASLTVTAVSAPGEEPAWFEVALIPETLAATGLGTAQIGTRVNIETDVLAKYFTRFMQFTNSESRS